MEAVSRKGGLLYPMLVIAAIAVIVFSVTGIAQMMGWLPSTLSQRDSATRLEQTAPRSESDYQRPDPSVQRAGSDAKVVNTVRQNGDRAIQ